MQGSNFSAWRSRRCILQKTGMKCAKCVKVKFIQRFDPAFNIVALFLPRLFQPLTLGVHTQGQVGAIQLERVVMARLERARGILRPR